MAASTVSLLVALGGAFASDYHDDFTAGTNGWRAGADWAVCEPTPDTLCYRGDSVDDAFAWQADWDLDSSWACAVDLTIADMHGDEGATGSGGLALSTAIDNPSPALLMNVMRHTSNMSLITVDYFEGEWHKLLSSGWLPGSDTSYRLELRRDPGDGSLHVTVTGDKGLVCSADALAVPHSLLDSMARLGLRANRAKVDFAEVRLATPSLAPSYYRTIAEAAVDDLLQHYWVGDASSGQIALCQ